MNMNMNMHTNFGKLLQTKSKVSTDERPNVQEPYDWT